MPSGSRSHLTRGAWIEITSGMRIRKGLISSHLTRGAWIEILAISSLFTGSMRRTSHEVRGLKYNPETGEVYAMSVAPHTRCVGGILVC